ncbi:MAG: hypothetical protein U0176_10410 [Bacteroidia bacterium]
MRNSSSSSRFPRSTNSSRPAATRQHDQRGCNLIERLAKQEKLDKDTLSMFRKDDRLSAVLPPHAHHHLIDGSRCDLWGATPAHGRAIQGAVIDYMASRIAGYDTYITMFGPLNPILARNPATTPSRSASASKRCMAASIP